MRNLLILSVLLTFSLTYYSCNKKDDKSEIFVNLTDRIWISDSLLVNGIDASGPGEFLEKFAGEANFKVDGTGTFGQYSGDWYLSNQQTDITIISTELGFPLTCNIVELSATSFKITTSINDPVAGQLVIRITFKAK